MKLNSVLISAALTFSALIPGSTFASTQVSARVTYAGIYGDGRLFVNLDTQIPEPNCSAPRFDVPANHPQIKNWLAIAMTAFTTGATIVVRVNGCIDNLLPTMTQGTDTFFYLQK